MMATEATCDKSADAPSPTNSEPVTGSETAIENAEPKLSTVNGSPTAEEIENKHITSVEEQGPSTDVSVSGGSDTDASKADPSKPKPDKGHARASSTVRRPATFKAVSVNRTFLASKSGSDTPASKAGDKSPAAPGTPGVLLTGSAVAANRPRLIAKTGSGSRDSLPRFSASGGKPASVPDPSTVWNKNRPVPTPEPKKLSDEELKKYGIHMATRLQSEDMKGQSNWADIDDDDDDWAPEAITWTDGTKITLPSADEPQTQAADSTSVATETATVNERLATEKYGSPTPSRTASPSMKSSNLASGRGLILKAGSADKASLVAKPPAPPGPAKSPWAALPPVQNASPVVTEPPAHHLGSRPQARDYSTAKSFAIPAAREIAADDFSRSTWRDGPTSSHRELYNSQSGRYEPVTDRRGSFRADMPARPSLLQRPHPSHDHPAEPSPSFQTTRAVQDVPYGRRRGSSNVSGGSGYLQRMGKPYEQGSMPPPDVLNARRGSVAASTDSQASRNFSGGRPQAAQGWQPQASPVATMATPHYPNAVPEPSQATQAAAVPGAPAAPLATIPPEEQAVEYQKRLMREKREEAIKRRLEEEAREEAAKAERIRLKLAAMGPPPERKSSKKEITIVRDLSSPTTAPAQPAATLGSPTTGSAGTQAGGPQAEQVSPPTDTSPTSPVSPIQKKAGPGSDTAAQSGQTGVSSSNQSPLWDSSAQPSGRFTSWPSSTQVSRNVWGSPNNDRGLGNGTFDPDLGRVVPETRTAPIPQPQLKGPAPIAPPTRMPGRSQPPGQAYPASRGDKYAAAEPRQYSDKQNQWVGAVLQTDTVLRDQRVKGRQDLDQRLADQGLSFEQAQANIKHTWRPESAVARMEAGGHATAPLWDRSSEGRSKHNVPASHDGQSANGMIGPGSSPLLTSGASATSSQTRLSRFFPSKDKDTRADAHPCTETGRGESPSPPPPTMDDHPVYDGDVSHPQVSFPKPQPIVKLPPARAATSGSARGQRLEPGWSSSSSGGQKANQALGPTQGGQQSATTTHGTPQSQQEWQKKIYELTGRKAAPKSPVVDSASRHALDQATQKQPATVSLPSQIAVRGAGDATSKPMAEECFEEQEMGSLPPVHLPRTSSAASWQPAPPPQKPLPRGFMVHPTTVRYFDVSDYSSSHIHVSFPWMRQRKSFPYNHNTGRANSRGSGHGRSGGRHRGPGAGYRGGGGGGKRDATSSYQSEPSANQQSSASSSAPRGGRGSYRGRSGDTWPRQSARPTT